MKKPFADQNNWTDSIFKMVVTEGGEGDKKSPFARLDDCCTRVAVVARTRWVMLSVVALYALFAAVSYSMSSIGFCFTSRQTIFLLCTFAMVMLYNVGLTKACSMMKNFSSHIHIQIGLDLFFVTVLIHFTGGIVSWFWPVYLLVTLEAAFLFEDRRDVWLIGSLGAVLYGALLTAEAFRILPPVSMPFIDSSLYNSLLLQSLQWLWVAGMNATVAFIGAFLMAIIRKDHQAVKDSEEALQRFINTANDLIFCCNADGYIIYSNQICRDILNFGHHEHGKRVLFDFVTSEYNDNLKKHFSRVVTESHSHHIELQLETNGIESLFVEMSLTASTKESGEKVVWGVCRDITERKIAQHELYKLAHHDILTGLPNRVLLEDRLQQTKALAHRTESSFAVLFLDLDRFKIINDTLGHAIGDELLRMVAIRLKAALRETDTIARIGGDEFIIVLQDIKDRSNTASMAEKITRSLSLPFKLRDHELFITTSLGIAIYPEHASLSDELMKKADIAMYHAKARGRNNYQFYSNDMDENASRRFMISNSLRRGLEQNEFKVFYQPKVSVSTGHIVAMEALVRWEHPELGLLSPVEFIQLAEENGLIMQLGEWVLRESCRQNKKWLDEDLIDMRVAVNLSGYQLQHTSLLSTIKNALAETGLSPNHLELEITESVIMQNPEAAVSILTEISDMGIHISIDDFGTGYSSLAHLKRFSVNTLKIDKSFVRDVDFSSTDAAIAAAIIAMGNSLNLNVIAEGVETEAQFEFLKLNNCHQVQGFLFSRPLPAEALQEILQANKDKQTKAA